MEVSEEQKRRIEANRAAALARRNAKVQCPGSIEPFSNCVRLHATSIDPSVGYHRPELELYCSESIYRWPPTNGRLLRLCFYWDQRILGGQRRIELLKALETKTRPPSPALNGHQGC